MIYPKNFEDKIGFTGICELLRNECLSPLGLQHVDKIKFSDDFEKLTTMLQQTAEFREMLLMERNFPSQDYFNLQPELKRLQTDGTWISVEAVKDLQASLKTIVKIIDFINSLEEEKYPGIKLLVQNIAIPKEILTTLNRMLDERGNISDKASPELAEIRASMRKKQIETDKRIRHFLQLAKKEGWVEESAEPSLRNDRVVIPLLAGNKRKIKGFVHDVSATGQTVFIEPEEIFDLNNAIRELENDERLEIIRILKEFTALLRPHLSALFEAYYFLGTIDFLQAKARLAIKTGGVRPLLVNSQTLSWWDAKHPLLMLSLEKQGKKIVPLTIALNEKQRMLIISGPNAGGKSVCLKTVGLLQYMLQCGLLVPMRETSEAGIFSNIFIDIGDEQSLENDLSTYSSHLLNMKNMVGGADASTLFLSDELGSGTEPQAGGAIAEAILEILLQKQAFAIVTTHYANLKLLANKHNSIKNAAMLFDTKEIKPLYQLQIGMPGSSFAFELAKNIGLQKEITDLAAKKIGQTHLDFEQQLQQIEVEKRQIEQEKLELQLADNLLEETLKKYQKLSADIERRKAEIIQKAKLEAHEIVAKTNQLVEKTIREIKENKAEKTATQKIREELHKDIDELINENKSQPTKTTVPTTQQLNKSTNHELKVGDHVKVNDEGVVMEVLEIKNKRAVVSSGLIRLTLAIEQLTWVPKQKQQQLHKQITNFKSIISEINDRKTQFKTQLDIRGMNAEQAIDAINKFLDDALLFSEKHLSILHGKGNGVLRSVVKDLLQYNKDVQHFRYAPIEQGGDGITVIEIK